MNKTEERRHRLVTQSICILIITLVLVTTRVRSNILPVVDLKPDQLIGSWEALVQREGMVGPSIYQMLFVSPKEAWLAQAASDSSFAGLQFLGRLTSEDLANGQIKLEFTALQGQSEPDYVSVQIEGRASSSGDLKIIEGEIIKKEKDGKATSDHVFFANTLWTRSIADASVAAEKAILNARRRSKVSR